MSSKEKIHSQSFPSYSILLVTQARTEYPATIIVTAYIPTHTEVQNNLQFFKHTHTHTQMSGVLPTSSFCRILLWVLHPRWMQWLAAPEELVGRDSWAKLLKYGQEFPLSLPPRQLALLCAIMEIKCTEAWNDGGKEGEGGRGRKEGGGWEGKASDLWSQGSLRLLNRKITRLRNCWSFYEKLRDLGQY